MTMSNQDLMGEEPENVDERVTAALEKLRAAAAHASQDNLGGTLLALANATKAVNRIYWRSQSAPEEYEQAEFVQTRGPTVEFTGRLLGEAAWDSHGDDPKHWEIEIWSTRAGALVAVSITKPLERAGYQDVRVSIVEPSDDVQAMHFAVMDHFSWGDRARTLAREIGWDFRREVD